MNLLASPSLAGLFFGFTLTLMCSLQSAILADVRAAEQLAKPVAEAAHAAAKSAESARSLALEQSTAALTRGEAAAQAWEEADAGKTAARARLDEALAKMELARQDAEDELRRALADTGTPAPPATLAPASVPPGAAAHASRGFGPPRPRTHGPVDGALPPLIFAATTGRTGTKWLSELIASSGQRCFHERHPLMSHQYLRLPPRDTYEERLLVKAGSIEWWLREHPEDAAYCDTSNYFAKSWADVVLDHFSDRRVTVVALRRRDPGAVVKSMTDLNWFGGKGRECGPFLYTVNSPVSDLPALRADADMDEFEKAIGMVHDVEAKVQRLRREGRRNVRVVDAWLEDLAASEDAVGELFAALGLGPVGERTREFLRGAGRANGREEKKRPAERRQSVEYCRERIAEWRAEYQRAGVPVPDLH